jgi:O-antigen/teichoic acid export membrane protein
MKVGKHVDGTLDEIKGLFSSNDSRLLEFLMPEAFQDSVRVFWVVVPAVLFVGLCISLAYWLSILGRHAVVMVVLAAAVAVWLVAVVHRKYQKPGLTGIVAVGALVILGLATQTVTLEQLLDRARDLRK